MRAVTAEEMKNIDRYAIEQLGIPSLLLMENAALRTIDAIDLEKRHSFAVFCGTGNNGGDGLAIARGLHALGKEVRVFLVGDPKRASEEFSVNRATLEHLNLEVSQVETLGDLDTMMTQLGKVNTIIDCLFGTGLNREVKGVAAVVIEQINQSRIFTISVDLPSGLDADRGNIWGTFVEPGLVVCLEMLKKGLVSNPYIHCPIRLVPIGIPEEAKRAILGTSYEKEERRRSHVRY